jgi:CD109 antigen
VVSLRAAGPANVTYQVVGRWYRPWRDAAAGDDPLAVKVAYDRTQLRVEDRITAHVRLDYRRADPTFMVIVDLGIPPGFTVIPEAFDALVEARTITRWELQPRQITVYLGEVRRGRPIDFSYQLQARFPVRAQTPRSVAYEYYTPSSRGVQEPVLLTVTGE